ncbi:MAG: peptidylprolyl isomerase [Chloroherpetonaceae bacterium]|nr:peptidylprolyl isomerase [Chloroherpetonaceae bacterium]MDW8020126.1 peptidylprolyl isomerase [Chloroherpetonaceae bacterium]
MRQIRGVFFCTFFFCCVTLGISACSNTQLTSSPEQVVVARIKQGNWQTDITLAEFEERYLETRRSAEEARKDSLTSYREFLDRLIDFKLKVKDAIDKGLENDPEVQNELRQYRNQLAQPYLTERELYENAIKDLYEKRKYEIDASHILVFVAPDASPADTERAFRKIEEALAELKRGVPFDSVAYKYSEDPTAKQNYGRLGYFTGGVMVHQFEDGVYATKVGEINGPFRTRFGYHIVKVWDKRPRTPDIRVAHILIGFGNGSPEDTLKAFEKISALLDSLNQGADFAELARRHSEDLGTAAQGGDLGFFGLGRTVKPFEEAAFALKNIGDVSPIVRTQFGYHLIKLLGRKKIASLEEEREELKAMLRRNPEKINAETNKLTERLKKLYGYQENPRAIALFLTKLDTTEEGYAKLETLSLGELKDTLCFAFAGRRYTLDSLLAYLRLFAERRKLTERDLVSFRNSYAQRELIDYETSQLEVRYPEFAKLMRDYKDGILLFTVSERTVWQKSTANDSIARAYYEAYKDDFQFGERVKVSQIVSSNRELIDKLRAELVEKNRTLDIITPDSVKKAQEAMRAALKALKRGKTYIAQRDSILQRLRALKPDTEPRSFDELAKRYSEQYDSTRRAELGTFQRGENMLADIVFGNEVGSISAPIQYEEKHYLLRVDGREAPRRKTFEEALPEIYSRYQDDTNRRLEAEWVHGLRAKSEIQIFEERLKQAFRTAANTETALTSKP